MTMHTFRTRRRRLPISVDPFESLRARNEQSVLARFFALG